MSSSIVDFVRALIWCSSLLSIKHLTKHISLSRRATETLSRSHDTFPLCTIQLFCERTGSSNFLKLVHRSSVHTSPLVLVQGSSIGTIYTYFNQIVLCVLGRRTGIYFISEIGTGAVPDQHTVPPYSWMRTDIRFFASST